MDRIQGKQRQSKDKKGYFYIIVALYNMGEVKNMELVKIVVISNNKTWCKQFSEQIQKYNNLTLVETVSDYKDLDQAMSEFCPDVLVADLDLLKTSGYSYEFIYDRIVSWDPKLPFVHAIGDNDHREINKGKMRCGVDYWSRLNPVDYSVKEVLHIIDLVSELIIEAKKKMSELSP